jgi:imidazolonepropionase-like amidohydrolase
MEAYRTSCVFDGERFLEGGGTVLVDRSLVAGVESYGFPIPTGAGVHDYHGASLLPGLIDTHMHLVWDSRDQAVECVRDLSEDDLTHIVEEALERQPAAGVTTVRDLGDRNFCVIDRRDLATNIDAVLDPQQVVLAGQPVLERGSTR